MNCAFTTSPPGRNREIKHWFMLFEKRRVAEFPERCSYAILHAVYPYSVVTEAAHTARSEVPSYTRIIIHPSYTVLYTKISRITPSILPTRPPPLLPLPTIKLLLPQLHINRIMRLAHPLPKLAATADARGINFHPFLKILGAHPARVQLAERA